MSNQIEEGLFYLLIFLTLKICWEVLFATVQIGWILVVMDEAYVVV